MYYHCVFINQGPARTRETAPAISVEGIHTGAGQGVLEALKSQVGWWIDVEIPTHTQLEGLKNQEGMFPDPREPEAHVC